MIVHIWMTDGDLNMFIDCINIRYKNEREDKIKAIDSAINYFRDLTGEIGCNQSCYEKGAYENTTVALKALLEQKQNLLNN